MAIDISSIVRKHLSANTEQTKEVTEGTVTDKEVTEGTVTDKEVTEGTVTDKEVTEGIHVDFSGLIESTSSNPVTESQGDELQDWFMSESEQESVSGALLASIVTNVVNV